MAENKGGERSIPSPEYINGEIPLQYSYTFPGKEKLEVSQDDIGISQIIIKQGDKILFDASTLLPTGWKFVTPAYVKKFPEGFSWRDKLALGGWVTMRDKKLIFCGEFKSPQEFLSLLHEIGHVKNDTPEHLAAERKIGEECEAALKKIDYEQYFNLLAEGAKLESKSERRAWAWTLLTLRKFHRDTGIDFRDIFPAVEDFKKYIRHDLAAHRNYYEWRVKGWGNLDSYHQELEKLFDKGKYQDSRPMEDRTERGKIDLLPKAVKQKEAIPPPCSIAKYYPDILLRNDGFTAEVAYTFDDFYARGASILGNLVRMRVDGAVLQVLDDKKGNKVINVLYLYDARRQLTTSFSVNSGLIQVHETPGEKPSILHERPELWSFTGRLPNGIKVSFMPVYDIPLNYTIDAPKISGGEARNLDVPAIVIAYGRKGIVDYAYENFRNPPKSKSVNTLLDEDIINALHLITADVSRKWEELMPDKEIISPEIELK